MARPVTQPVLAGVVAALVGFGSTFGLVLAGLRAVGATPAQAASGLLVLCITMGATAIVLGLRLRMPISIAWSTPGAALLISAGHVPGGYPAALGAFALCGLLIVLAGLWARLGSLIATIPAPLASAMLAGVLLPVCITPVRAIVDIPGMAAPGVIAWVAMLRLDRRWAVPVAFAVTAVAIAVHPLHGSRAAVSALPHLSLTMPTLTVAAVIGLAVPLFVVTMASQNLPGMSVLASFGYRPPLRPLLLSTGAVSAAGAPFGAHAINLAAITAALVAGPDADPDPSRRWIASVSTGVVYLGLGLAAGLATALVGAAPPLLIEAIAGLALLGALTGALRAALEPDAHREAAVVTFVVSASSVTALSIGSPFWGLVAGLAMTAALRNRGARI